MKPDRVLSMIGMAARAGNLVSGEFSTERAVKKGQSKLVIIAGDASDNTKKHFFDMCAYRKVPYYEYSDKEQLGYSIGKQFRASLSVSDANLAKEIITRLNARDCEPEGAVTDNGGNE